MGPGEKNKKLIIWLVVAVIVIVTGLLLYLVQQEQGGGGAGSGERTAKELQDLVIPKVNEEAPEEGVGVPGKIAEGESSKPGQQYWVFETELREGKLDPFEFRLPVDNLLGISILNSEDKEHAVNISSESSFVPNFIERTIASGGTGSFRTQVLEIGEYSVFCTTCKEEVVGKFVVVPKL